MTRKEYLAYKLERADRALKVADSLVQQGYAEDAVNRIYYAVFYAVQALLYTQQLYPKTHLGAKSLFDKEFVQTGMINKTYADFYGLIFAKRFEADYQDFVAMDLTEVKKII